MVINDKYKDRLFKIIFGSEEYKENALALFNALSGKNVTDIDELEFTTIEDVIYMGKKNDVSFLIQSMMPLFEHQSTFNPNMPIRGLMYYSRLYDNYIEKNELNKYGTKLIKIPTPQYIVFYNGTEDYPDKKILRLSDSFMTKINDENEIYEWTAIMLNINKGRNLKLLDSCKPLADYAEVIHIIRNNISKYGRDEGVKKGVDECIEKNLFKDILLKNKSEVIGMFLTDYDEQKQLEIERREAKEEGIREGMQQGLIALINSVKEITNYDLDKITEIVRKNDIYKDVSVEEIKKYL